VITAVEKILKDKYKFGKRRLLYRVNSIPFYQWLFW